jgi:hypothetical protein
MLITLMTVATGGIGLPNFDQGFRNGTTVFIHHATAYQDALADRLASVLPSQISICGAYPIMSKHRAGDF